MLNRCSVGCAPRRRQPREGEWEPRKRTAADCEGGPEVQRLSQLAREKKKRKEKRTETENMRGCVCANGAVQQESGGNGPIHGVGVGRGA